MHDTAYANLAQSLDALRQEVLMLRARVARLDKPPKAAPAPEVGSLTWARSHRKPIRRYAWPDIDDYIVEGAVPGEWFCNDFTPAQKVDLNQQDIDATDWIVSGLDAKSQDLKKLKRAMQEARDAVLLEVVRIHGRARNHTAPLFDLWCLVEKYIEADDIYQSSCP